MHSFSLRSLFIPLILSMKDTLEVLILWVLPRKSATYLRILLERSVLSEKHFMFDDWPSLHLSFLSRSYHDVLAEN